MYVHQEPKLLQNDKDAKENVGFIPWICFKPDAGVSSGILLLNVSYLFLHLLICVCQLRCHEKQVDLTYNMFAIYLHQQILICGSKHPEVLMII